MAKRLLDILGGLVGTVLLIIIFPFVALATLIDTGRPNFYRQERLGKGAQPYNIIKFRTMVVESEKDGKPQFAKEHNTPGDECWKISPSQSPG